MIHNKRKIIVLYPTLYKIFNSFVKNPPFISIVKSIYKFIQISVYQCSVTPLKIFLVELIFCFDISPPIYTGIKAHTFRNVNHLVQKIRKKVQSC